MKNKVLAGFLAILTVGVWSCSEDFLVEPPQGSYSETSLANRRGVDGLLIGTYAALDGLWFETWGNNNLNQTGGASNWIWGSIRSEEAYKGTEPNDFVDINPIENFTVQPSNGALTGKWNATYDGMGKANETLRVLASISPDEISDEDRARIQGEARFLRSHFFFEAVKVFNRPVFVDETVGTAEGPAYEDLTNDGDVWAPMEADFEFAFNNLPGTMDAAGRANKWAAAAMLGKVYLYQGKWNDAKRMFDQVINEGTTAGGIALELEELYLDNFNAAAEPTNSEEIFSYEASATGDAFNGNYENTLNQPHGGAAASASGGASAGCCGFFQPSQTLVNAFEVDDNGLPLINSFNDEDVRDDEAFASADNPDYMPFGTQAGEMVDARLDWTVGRRGIPYLDWGPHPGRDWIRDVTNGGPYSPIKNVPRVSDAANNLGGSFGWGYTLSALNVKIIRLADVMLMLAEAEAELGNVDRALELVNMVRMRAANEAGFVMSDDGTPAANYMVGTYDSFGGQADALEKIRFERLLELGMEGHRFFDLVRWDNATDAGQTAAPFDIVEHMNRYANSEDDRLHLNGFAFEERDKYAPIPEFVITRATINGEERITQNDGF